MRALNNYWDASFRGSGYSKNKNNIGTNHRRRGSEIKASAGGGDGVGGDGGDGNEIQKKRDGDDGSEGGDGPAYMAAGPLLSSQFGVPEKDLYADLRKRKEYKYEPDSRNEKAKSLLKRFLQGFWSAFKTFMHGLKYVAPYLLPCLTAFVGVFTCLPSYSELDTLYPVFLIVYVPLFTAISVLTDWIGIKKGLNIDKRFKRSLIVNSSLGLIAWLIGALSHG